MKALPCLVALACTQHSLAAEIALPSEIPATSMSNWSFVYTGEDNLVQPWWSDDSYGQPLDPAKWGKGAAKHYQQEIGLQKYIINTLMPAAVSAVASEQQQANRRARRPASFDRDKYLGKLLVPQGANEFEKRRSLDEQKRLLLEAPFEIRQPFVVFFEVQLYDYNFQRGGYLAKIGRADYFKHRPDFAAEKPLVCLDGSVPRFIVKQGDIYFEYGFFLPVPEAQAESWSKQFPNPIATNIVAVVEPVGFVFYPESEPRIQDIAVRIKTAGLYARDKDTYKLLQTMDRLMTVPEPYKDSEAFAAGVKLRMDQRYLDLPAK